MGGWEKKQAWILRCLSAAMDGNAVSPVTARGPTAFTLLRRVVFRHALCGLCWFGSFGPRDFGEATSGILLISCCFEGTVKQIGIRAWRWAPGRPKA